MVDNVLNLLDVMSDIKIGFFDNMTFEEILDAIKEMSELNEIYSNINDYINNLNNMQLDKLKSKWDGNIIKLFAELNDKFYINLK